jgi:tRNA(His) 5'-end guanylyltransferase
MVTYNPSCTYEIRSFKYKIFFWEKTCYVIVRIDNDSFWSSRKTLFFDAPYSYSEELCWDTFERSTKYWFFKRAKRHLDMILASGKSDKIEDNLTLEYSTNDNSIILEDPLEQKFKLLEG